MENWYALQTKPRQEILAEENLQRQAYKTYMPQILMPRRRNGALRKVIEPLFSRYLFLSIDLTQDNTAPIRSTYGVVGLVRFGNYIRPVSSEIIHHLKQSENPETGLYEPVESQFKKGDNIQIAEGPLEGLDGVFQMKKGQDRALVLIDILGKQSMVTLKQHAIAPVLNS